jgi:D-serine deaminase-like pyridoxal phosphate-dependent protein
VLSRNDLTVARLSEEHAVVTASDRTGLSVGNRLVIVPTHACTTVNLHAALLLLSRDRGTVAFPVNARGW